MRPERRKGRMQRQEQGWAMLEVHTGEMAAAELQRQQWCQVRWMGQRRRDVMQGAVASALLAQAELELQEQGP